MYTWPDGTKFEGHFENDKKEGFGTFTFPSGNTFEVRICSYRKIPVISPGLIFVQKAFLLGLFSGELIFRGACYRKEFCISKWVWFVNRNSNSNSPWAYIREGLLSEGYFCLRFGLLIFGRAYFWEDLLLEFYGIFCAAYVGLYRASDIVGWWNFAQLTPNHIQLHNVDFSAYFLRPC